GLARSGTEALRRTWILRQGNEFPNRSAGRLTLAGPGGITRRQRRESRMATDSPDGIDAENGRSAAAEKPRRATLADVASRAGVSSVTVSRALRRPHLVSDTLRRRIESAVRGLAYIPNQMASALASAQTDTIGLGVPSLTNGLVTDS